MELTVLGCSGSAPAPESPSSGYLLRSGDTRLVIDLGNGTMGPLQRWTDPFDVNALLLTHLHPDHCADFAPLAVYLRYRPNKPYDPTQRRMPVYAPREAPSRLAALYAPSAEELGQTDLSDVFEFLEPPAEPVRVGDFEIRAFPVDHLCPTWGLRIEAEDRVFAFTGDTGPSDEIAKLAAGADVLLSEASWLDSPDQPAGVHLSGKQAGAAAASAGVRRLLLTHYSPWTDQQALLGEAREAFDGPAELVRAGSSYTI
ncbi:ribonuclease BN (tRNA processing enzyme) [Saccharopolyspora erythraea NRRL 2338]|uniref:MBL fold metallo-hydrolase n=1 Tax=Saccharopolyspora erythraea TaxID=1836 RepID=A0ABN1C5C7_SACER|nr:MBL fold metallo-hydrolase [Saccharopolyspora erythraea]EQD83106.1 beta-lactamase [Saccharopolyspora erythraea D]PFG97270.1 ribonuclease BN (tRNA processing enzyme) [Saccharopolyspora erythraea NRRL 2338]QRK87465.1 MBL fold metallo-hydrolase [Saccharopolyspora erythraea]